MGKHKDRGPAPGGPLAGPPPWGAAAGVLSGASLADWEVTLSLSLGSMADHPALVRQSRWQRFGDRAYRFTDDTGVTAEFSPGTVARVRRIGPEPAAADGGEDREVTVQMPLPADLGMTAKQMLFVQDAATDALLDALDSLGVTARAKVVVLPPGARTLTGEPGWGPPGGGGEYATEPAPPGIIRSPDQGELL